MILVKNDLGSVVDVVSLNKHYIIVKITANDNSSIRLINIYRPCDGMERSNMLNEIKNWLSQNARTGSVGDLMKIRAIWRYY